MKDERIRTFKGEKVKRWKGGFWMKDEGIRRFKGEKVKRWKGEKMQPPQY
ncbi:hypothetical protein HMPREF9151_00290 [Hoylesella saccharolytica F0055]|uniref:Uncharacterized protein n=1 Tax=Hoylesella saccharolytica F0055 TaxID=1127699 RepID=L1NJQ6_9BACT|nr:hypothetical protein HMPREF9151_00290 [Hoylesella saccharolytica F0055]